MLSRICAVCVIGCATLSARADSDVYLLGVPDYSWYAGCFGTASGNLMGYWDRHGLPNFYTGPVNGGVAPLVDDSLLAIRSLWASSSHMADYWLTYESSGDDPYVTARRAEHTPDCIGDFIGLNQRKWFNMNEECDGNVDGYSFVYWDTNGNRRVNFTQLLPSGSPATDIQSGLREWTRYRGSDADVFTQLADFNPRTPPGRGFTFEDVKTEINAGYPLLVFLQDYNQFSRSFTNNMSRGNPEIHGVLIFGYQEFPEFGVNYVRIKTSWGFNDYFRAWAAHPWFPINTLLSVRGVIGYRPKPKVVSIQRVGNEVALAWHGPSSEVYNALAGTTNSVHRYQVEKSTAISGSPWKPVGSRTTQLTNTFTHSGDASEFYRVKLLAPGE